MDLIFLEYLCMHSRSDFSEFKKTRKIRGNTILVKVILSQKSEKCLRVFQNPLARQNCTSIWGCNHQICFRWPHPFSLACPFCLGNALFCVTSGIVSVSIFQIETFCMMALSTVPAKIVQNNKLVTACFSMI